jgi:hypothetical protein
MASKISFTWICTPVAMASSHLSSMCSHFSRNRWMSLVLYSVLLISSSRLIKMVDKSHCYGAKTWQRNRWAI